MAQGMTSTHTGGPSEEQVRLKLQGLQHEVERTAIVARWLGRLAILLVILLIAVGVSIYLYHVMQYATVTRVGAAAADGRPGVAEIEYTPSSSGRIEFVRESEGLVQTLIEYARDPSGSDPTRKFTWSGKNGEKSSLRVTYRSGLFLVTTELPVAGVRSKE